MEEFKGDQNEEANVQAEVQQKAQDASVKKGKTLFLPTIETMLFNMEQANGNPTKALQYLKTLFLDTEIILQMQQSAPSQEAFE